METYLVRLTDKKHKELFYLTKSESLAMGYLASYLRNSSFKAKILDEDISGSSRKHTLKQLQKADLIAFAATARPQIFPIIKTVKELKRQGWQGHVSIGGHYATFLYKELLNLPKIFDSVVRFEGEQTFLELAKAIKEGKPFAGIRGLAFKEKGRIKENLPRPLIEDLDSLPFPARDTLEKVLRKGGLPSISSSRGCYNNCSYCSISRFYSVPKGKIMRFRSPGNVLEELQELKQRFPRMSKIWFVDDNFTIPGKEGLKRTTELCNGIKNLDIKFEVYLRPNDINKKLLQLLKKSGVSNVFVGMEAANDFTLQKIFNKNTSVKQTLEAIKLCNSMNIELRSGFIMFHPWSTMQEIEQNIKFLEETKQRSVYFFVSHLTVYRFTPIGQKMLSGELPYKKPEFQQKHELNDFVSYEIEDERTELMLCLTLDAFWKFKNSSKLLVEMMEKTRILKLDGKKKKATELEKKRKRALKKIEQTAMRFFKELFYFMKETELKDSKIEPFFSDFKTRLEAEVKKITEEDIQPFLKE